MRDIDEVVARKRGWRLVTGDKVPKGIRHCLGIWMKGRKQMACEECGTLPPVSLFDEDAVTAANDICMQRKMFWRAHSPAHWADDDTDYWFGFTSIGFTGWNGRSEYEGHGKTLAGAICNAILELPEVQE